MTFYIPKKALLMCATRLRPQDVFATSLYTGSGSSRGLGNGLDLAGKGGLVWIKARGNAYRHVLSDTSRPNAGNSYPSLYTNLTEGESQLTDSLTAFTNSGFSLGADPNSFVNGAGQSYVAWAWREARKFFVKLTYTGNGQSGRQIPHGLGDVPGMIVVKARTAAENWAVWHRANSFTNGNLILNSTAAAAPGTGMWNSTSPTASVFTVGNNPSVNDVGIQYVAYLFAHNPDLIDCGSYVGNGSASGPTVTCGKGWGPQFLMIKNASAVGNWAMIDAARSPTSPRDEVLFANASDAEVVNSTFRAINTNASGFQVAGTGSDVNASGNTYVYLAIRSPT